MVCHCHTRTYLKKTEKGNGDFDSFTEVTMYIITGNMVPKIE